MDVVEHYESSERFHEWVANIVNNRRELIRHAISKSEAGEFLDETEFLHTRYFVNGLEGKEQWPNFQLDGFGTWLWSLARHKEISKSTLPEDWIQAAELVADYLIALWEKPCYDCWEEFSNKIHTYTLAAINGGLKAFSVLTGIDNSNVLAKIKKCVYENAFSNGHFTKYIGTDIVDASLLGLAVPYGFVEPDNPMMRATVDEIEIKLTGSGGIRRNQNDTYYGGGEWILLTAWLGWYYVIIGDYSKAKSTMQWVEEQADHANNLPEQVSGSLIAPIYYQHWTNKWGESAKTLLWSHAKYLILHNALERAMG
jgi:GH15 family glucan-1,4-alpha-glucosidase